MTLLDELSAEAITKDVASGWTRTNVTSIPELRNPELLAPFAKAYLSEKSVTIKDNRTRRIVGPQVTPGELSRLYLGHTMDEGLESGGPKMLAKRVPWRRDALQFLDRRPAYFFKGQTGGPFELIDISACYATLYSRLTLDVTYRPECDPPLLGLGAAAFQRTDEWNQAKGPRNALWGNLLRPKGREWRHGTPVDDAYPNKFFAPDLAGIVLDAAHAIALEARETFGALSWAVDGGAFRPGEGRAFAQWLSSSFALIADVRAEGPGWLFGPTSYSVGPVITHDVKKGRAHEWPETDNLRPQSSYLRQWIAGIFRGWA